MPTTTGSATVTLPEDNQILISREFDAPAHLVWQAWTTPELVKKWWAGKRGNVTLVEIDLRVGGKWRYVMNATEGFEVGFHGEYKELVENERMVSTEVYEGLPPEMGDPDDLAALNTLTLTERDGRTTLEVLVEHKTKEQRDGHIESGMEGGMQESMDALEEVAVSLK
ncbi:MAG TPA: SRPBCC family protein [Solirubrobacterales bacterium]|nr:SRPBCC family protein [Solirubrobacterales bacterium]